MNLSNLLNKNRNPDDGVKRFLLAFAFGFEGLN
jgi:hypothetical protein